ncbi:hypothetical protein GGTG_05899 [Gaeumannomyces tritici R3-111a-1]|uniref:Uncharacterized protein n=1 Tax=Gaeumannomyces tritici (strain R3-111a-1) TaxID=644352 RepID=J3NX92_GAET3|nr:hypothetical protein GGTG_05899 [Gaeumannomyces tritici R3-111a-1]EJT75974.1 hypothetical protein GGTG_05899 [Gaeumannomyces tritici R3-111a-1]
MVAAGRGHTTHGSAIRREDVDALRSQKRRLAKAPDGWRALRTHTWSVRLTQQDRSGHTRLATAWCTFRPPVPSSPDCPCPIHGWAPSLSSQALQGPIDRGAGSPPGSTDPV